MHRALIRFAISFSTIFCSLVTSSAQEAVVLADELEVLIGEWAGSLTYVDYSSNKPYTMPAEVRVERGKNECQLVLFTSYPKEPHANHKGQIKLSKKGRAINKEKVVSKEIDDNGDLQVVTEYSGKDNRRKALIRNIYLMGKDRFNIKKEVQFEGSEDWIRRNEYAYKR